MRDTSPDHPVIGILGGGQLAGMLARAARSLGCEVRILEREGVEPVASLKDRTVFGDWNHSEVLLSFAATVDVVTLENEFIDPTSLSAIEEAGHRLVPSSRTLHLIQDKLTQKRTLANAGLPVPEFYTVTRPADLASIAERSGHPLMLKRRQMSYDGKGNALLNRGDDPDEIWRRLGVVDGGLFAEAFCDFDRELATIVVRSRDGSMIHYPVVETVQQDHICHKVLAPARVSPDAAERAAGLARRAVEAVEGEGAFGVEMFLMKDTSVLINELAPRVHNSGHYTIEACETSQFENHIRAVLDRPLGPVAMRCRAAVMANILGTPEERAPSERTPAASGVWVHLYGKKEWRPGRKMGHVTALGESVDEALDKIRGAWKGVTA